MPEELVFRSSEAKTSKENIGSTRLVRSIKLSWKNLKAGHWPVARPIRKGDFQTLRYCDVSRDYNLAAIVSVDMACKKDLIKCRPAAASALPELVFPKTFKVVELTDDLRTSAQQVRIRLFQNLPFVSLDIKFQQ